MVTTALGFTPYNSTNPSGYITGSGSITGSSASCTVNAVTATNRFEFDGGSIAVPDINATQGTLCHLNAEEVENAFSFYEIDLSS